MKRIRPALLPTLLATILAAPAHAIDVNRPEVREYVNGLVKEHGLDADYLNAMLESAVTQQSILDAMAMIILLVPIVYPVIVQLGFDPIWFGIIVVMTVELGLITPPVGMNVFVINSIARDVNLVTIFRGVFPFVLADVLRLIILVAFPAIVLFLPTTMN